jgi:hypothetical protein
MHPRPIDLPSAIWNPASDFSGNAGRVAIDPDDEALRSEGFRAIMTDRDVARQHPG